MDFIYLILGIALIFFAAERILPGRTLPHTTGWYLRALLLNLCQLGIILLAGLTWELWFQGHSLLSLANIFIPSMQGLLSWFIGTFVFYWWHREGISFMSFGSPCIKSITALQESRY
jgi:sterol desaturase/sphingolipid hydroxylase (fatty acid hydroxylase superfamily)